MVERGPLLSVPEVPLQHTKQDKGQWSLSLWGSTARLGLAL